MLANKSMFLKDFFSFSSPLSFPSLSVYISSLIRRLGSVDNFSPSAKQGNFGSCQEDAREQIRGFSDRSSEIDHTPPTPKRGKRAARGEERLGRGRADDTEPTNRLRTW